MKFNKWTMGLAAIGAVSLTSAAKAEEKTSFVQDAVSGTTISGYVDTSLEWSVDPAHSTFSSGLGSFSSPANGFSGGSELGVPFRANKQNGFNLNVVEINISKPLDETPWASGYNVSLLFGPDAVGYNPSANGAGGQFGYSQGGDFAIKDANVVLRAPIGNGLEIKMGVFDTVIGYEVFEAGNNPNFTRSWGYAIEPTQHTGLLFTYHINDNISVSAGIANTLSSGINTRDTSHGTGSYWQKTALASVTLTAPQSWGWASGASFSAGMVYGFDQTFADNRLNLYAGITIPTPIKGLAFGASFDYTSLTHDYSGVGDANNFYGYGYHYHYRYPYASHYNYDRTSYTGKLSVQAYSFALYATWQATEKLSLNLRGEFAHADYTDRGFADNEYYNYEDDGYGSDSFFYRNFGNVDVFSITGTLQYNLWANVISRLEVRYDTADFANHERSTFEEGTSRDHSSGSEHQLSVYLNIIYKF